jgi:hypothetical protein
VPTFYHAWVAPHEETWQPFMLGGVGATVSLLAVGSITFVVAGFPIYLMVVDFGLGINVYVRQRVVPGGKAVASKAG